MLLVPQARIVRDPAEILALQPQLRELAARCGQAGEADSLDYFLARPNPSRRRPCLLLFSDTHTVTGQPPLSAAVLVLEYTVVRQLLSLRVFSTTDASGRRDLLAPPAQRARYAALAALALLQRGAHVVKIDFREGHTDHDAQIGQAGHIGQPGPARQPPIEPGERRSSARVPAEHESRLRTANILRTGLEAGAPVSWALRSREEMLYLPLLPTFDATLARIGQKTRANLRYYRRRAEAALGCTFVPEARIGLEEFLALSRRSFAAVTDAESRRRFELLRVSPASFLAGIQDREGRWLSIVRCRRQGRFAEIDWLLNRADFPEFSLGTVIRSYLLEHLIALGCTRLYIEGGTGTPLKHSFLWGPVAELTVKRKSAYVRLLELLARSIPVKDHVAEALRSPDLTWTNL